VHDRSSRKKLTSASAVAFAGTTLFDHVARVVCSAEAVPRKELYESWQMATRVRRHLQCGQGGRIVDLACGHGLLGMLCLLLDDKATASVGIDRRIPPSAHAMSAVFTTAFPRFAGRVSTIEADIATASLTANDVVVSAHACGPLTDTVIAAAIDVGAAVAVMPCCHREGIVAHALRGWMDNALAQDAARAVRLSADGRKVWTTTIDDDVTEKNRVLLASAR
jgi:Methyltransferase domain